MATTGELYPASAASVDRSGNTAWDNPANAKAADASDTTATVPTDYLVVSNFNASIPSGSTIDGVTVRVYVSETGSGGSDYVPQLISDATPTLIGSAKSAVAVSGSTKVISTSGGASDKWSATLTDIIVNDSGFGVAIWSTDSFGGNEIQVDYITIEIHYTEGGPPIPNGSGDPGDFFFVMRDED